ncbi:MAG: 6-bladed beta-propeller, partial [Bacteroidales bacterium]|nr:6-bladed beta-propeller [Bacteroidales bacterium]
MDGTKDLYEYVANDFKQIIPIHKIDIDKESANFKYSEIFSSVKYVKLEATENSSIGEIEKIETTDSGDFIVFDKYNARIVRFDSLGNYLNNIGIKGRSKKEYVDPTDMMYDPYNEQVSVCDRGTQTIKFYNIDGTFINQIKFPIYFSHFGIISKDEIVVFR